MRLVLLALFPALAAFAQTPIFMEPTQKVDTNRAEIDDLPQTFRRVDGAKILPWMENAAARRALQLYAQAYRILEEHGNPQKQPKDYYIALVPDGNHAAVGFRLQTDAGVEDHLQHAFILLDPSPYRFHDTILHESAHVAMSMLAGGKLLPRADVASIPHSTASLTDRGTAFSEGYAIHFETLAAQTATEPADRGRFFHERVVFGGGPYPTDEYFRHAADLATYSQNVARYTEVRDNNYSFQPAWQGPDYLRIQLEKARNFAEIRSANQLLQSEGFYASFFYLFLMRGEKPPSEEVIATRQERILRAMHAMFESVKPEPDTPWLVEFVRTYMKVFPDEKSTIVSALNELSHGAFVDPNAATLWRSHYLAALRLDLRNLNREQILKTRRAWEEKVSAHPEVLTSMVGPQIRCEIREVQVKLEAFGRSSPLVFDINTAPEAILRLVPGTTPAQVDQWTTGRPFTTIAAFQTATGIKACKP